VPATVAVQLERRIAELVESHPPELVDAELDLRTTA
jgi:hypothetical protein